MSSSSMSCSDVLNMYGFRPFGYWGKAVGRPRSSENDCMLNCFNVAGVCPVLSIISGLFRAAANAMDLYSSGWREGKGMEEVSHIFRGVGEALQLGILFLLIDVIFTVGRMLTAK